MKPRAVTNLLAGILASVVLYLAISGIGKADDPPAPDPPPVTVQGKTAAQWHTIAARYRAAALKHWHPYVDYAYTLASAVYGIPRWQLHAVGSCESNHYPFARNGVHLGVMQLHWRPFGLSPYDPIANVLSAAATVRHDGGWRQWECKP